MKRTILFIILISSISILSQSKFVAGASFNVGFPTGSFSNDAKTGIGGSIIGEYFINKNFSTLLTVSYQNFPGNFPQVAVQGMVLDASFNSIPVVAAGRYYFGEGAFAALELGCYFFRLSVDASDLYNDERYKSEYQAKFGGALDLGYRFNLSEQSAMEFTGAYQIVQDDFSSFALRLGILIYLDRI
jgi:hypothetical protein